MLLLSNTDTWPADYGITHASCYTPALTHCRGLRHNTCKLLHSNTDTLLAANGMTHANYYTPAQTYCQPTTA